MSEKRKTIIYGVDINKKITPVMVRDAIIQCFYEAHGDILELAKEFFGDPNQHKFDEMKKSHVRELIENIFDRIGKDFNKPTKEGLIQVVDYLKKIAKVYRKPDVIKKHVSEIMQLIDKIE